MNPLWETSIRDLQKALRSGELTSRELVLGYLQRIQEHEKQGASLHAISELNPQALQLADALDRERRIRGERGPLHGIPILIKDNIATADQMHTTAGSLALADSYAARDAYLVEKLRQAGAILLGKTNMTEWANFMSHDMPNGYSSRGGQVRNPYAPGLFDCGGSSSGSGAAVAAGFTAAAVGTETSGSILNPAANHSLVGIKPTVGLISRSGIIPIAVSQDTPGPMARTVEDAAILLGTMTGVDEHDPATRASQGLSHYDYTPFLNKNGLRGARIGVVRSFAGNDMSEDQQLLYQAALTILEAQGAMLVHDISFPFDDSIDDPTVLFHEFKSGVNAYLSSLPASFPLRTLKDVIAWNKEHAEEALRYGQDILERSEGLSGSLTEPDYLASRLRDLTLSRTEGLDALFHDHQLDCVLFPHDFGEVVGAKAGYPSITVPAGYEPSGKPFGIMFTGRAFSEPQLIRIGYAYEQASLLRRPPLLV
ncbi:amidase family protein [Brevibacillus ruminantium]|uniref:Amidase family protein n=1 Tax=Brevibacillus ruminantium TaxID=2950604 RepID=A0ABY4W8U7_9BACL|nr:amidase family protein [Brevibacillus ruminantium]USG63442.1 amidase family protein [Brevibacillus ruminantium]